MKKTPVYSMRAEKKAEQGMASCDLSWKFMRGVTHVVATVYVPTDAQEGTVSIASGTAHMCKQVNSHIWNPWKRRVDCVQVRPGTAKENPCMALVTNVCRTAASHVLC